MLDVANFLSRRAAADAGGLARRQAGRHALSGVVLSKRVV